jgi:hypothetical protein
MNLALVLDRMTGLNLQGLRCAPALVLLMVMLVAGAPETSSIVVRAGEDLQQALNAARPGDTILLEPGATYVGNFVLPAKNGGEGVFITVRSSAPDWTLPESTERISPEHEPRLPKIKSPNSQPALATAPGAHHYRLLFLELQANAQGVGDIITLGDGSSAQSSLSQVPHDLIVDRCYIHGDPAYGQKRGIALNSASTSVLNSYIADIKAIGQESQAIGGWNGPGPFTIVNNYLEAAGENITFGGTDPSIPNLVPSDILVRRNHMAKPLAWRSEKWVVKSLFQLKNARRARISENLLENNWLAAQTGFAVLFTVRNQDGRCRWCQIEDVVFEHNTVRHVAAGVSILGRDNVAPSEQTRRITIQHNVFADVDNQKFGGNGYFLMVQGEPRDLIIDHNTIIQDHAYGIVVVDGPPILGFVFTNNLVRHNSYGFIGTDRGVGQDTISTFFPASQITANVIADGDPRRYPQGNQFPSSAEFRRQFVSYESGDYHLAAESPWRGAGTDRLDLGANQMAAARETPRPRDPVKPSRGAPPGSRSTGNGR